MTLEQSIKQLEQFRRMLKPGDVDRALECVLNEVKNRKERPVYNPTNQNKRREEFKKEKAVTENG